MSRPAWLRFLSALAQFLQVVNAGLSSLHPDPIVALCVSAALMAVQSAINESAIATPPPVKEEACIKA